MPKKSALHVLFVQLYPNGKSSPREHPEEKRVMLVSAKEQLLVAAGVAVAEK